MGQNNLAITLIVLYNLQLLIGNYMLAYYFGFKSNAAMLTIFVGINVVIMCGLFIVTLNPVCFKKRLQETFTNFKENFNNMAGLADFTLGDKEDDLILDHAPPVISDDKSHIVLSSDEEIAKKAQENIQEIVHKQPQIIHNPYLHEQAETQLEEEWLAQEDDRNSWFSENEKGNTDEKSMDNKRRDYISDHGIELDITTGYEQEKDDLAQTNYNNYLIARFNSTDRKKILEYNKDNGVTENQLDFWLKREKIKAVKEFKEQMIQNRVEILKTEELSKLYDNEVQYLTDERYMQGNIYKSEELQKSEYKNPYVLLPLDLWYKPDPSAIDISKKDRKCNCDQNINNINTKASNIEKKGNILPILYWRRPIEYTDIYSSTGCSCPNETKGFNYSSYDTGKFKTIKENPIKQPALDKQL